MSPLSLNYHLPIPKHFNNNSLHPQLKPRFNTTNTHLGFVRINPGLRFRRWAKPINEDEPLPHQIPVLRGSAAIEADGSRTIISSGAASEDPSSRSFLSILCPLLNLLGGGDPSQPRNQFIEVATSSLSSAARFAWGSKSLSSAGLETNRATMNLQLFEFEACPFCRRVREAATELDLSLEIYPCPKGSVRHRNMVIELGGKEQFPFLVDPNFGVSMYESSEIVKYLFKQYGQGKNPSFGLLGSTILTGWVPTILRAGRGLKLWENAKRDGITDKLVLFSYENNPYARIVREALCELELPYILQNVGEGSPRVDVLRKLSGGFKVPYLVDPNTGIQLSSTPEILSYLFETYSC